MLLDIIFSPNALTLIYFAAALLFIEGIKGLASPRTARRGNTLAMLGMGLAIAITLALPAVHNKLIIFSALAGGAIIGIPLAARIKMTALPQLVALFNGFVGLAAALVACSLWFSESAGTTRQLIEISASVFAGMLTFTGSVIAFGKLGGYITGKPILFPLRHILNLILFVVILVCAGLFVGEINAVYLWVMLVLSAVIGITLVLPIGGADMPVVVALLNSYSGWAAVATGFMLNNILLVITGALVGASGAILSYIMCKAMNRSFINVLMGGFGSAGGASSTRSDLAGKTVKEAAIADAAFMLENATNVIIVPGYGMAVAQAQHALKTLMDELEAKGVNVRFAIHPVAGRMPGHMNVLLAEADVPYENTLAMDDINPDFPQADVVLVVGANDVVNPDAQTIPGSPLYGMPILEAYKAKLVYVVKRSMNKGYAGVENALFYQDNTSMLFGDAKAVAERLLAGVQG